MRIHAHKLMRSHKYFTQPGTTAVLLSDGNFVIVDSLSTIVYQTGQTLKLDGTECLNQANLAAGVVVETTPAASAGTGGSTGSQGATGGMWMVACFCLCQVCVLRIDFGCSSAWRGLIQGGNALPYDVLFSHAV